MQESWGLAFHNALVLRYDHPALPLVVATATGSLVLEGDGKLITAFDRWLYGG